MEGNGGKTQAKVFSMNGPLIKLPPRIPKPNEIEARYRGLASAIFLQANADWFTVRTWLRCASCGERWTKAEHGTTCPKCGKKGEVAEVSHPFREEIEEFLESTWCRELLESLDLPAADPRVLVDRPIERKR